MNENLSWIINSVSDAVILTDLHNRITKMNPAAEQLTGMDAGNAISRPLEEVLRIVSLNKHEEYFIDLTEQLSINETVSWNKGDAALILHDHTRFHISGSAARFYGKEDEIPGIIMVFRKIDIKERTDSQQRESEQRYMTLFEKSNIPIVLMKLPEVFIIGANEAAEKLTGFKKEEMIGKNSGELGMISLHQRNETIDLYKAHQKLINNEMRIITKSGEERIINISTHPIELDGQTFAFTSMRDITEQKRAEKKLRESEEKYRGLMESLDSSVATINYDGKFLYMNEIAARQLGRTPMEMIGKTMHEIFPEPVASLQLEGVRQVFRENKGHVSENLSFVRGQPRWFRNSLQPIRDEHGEVVYVLLHSTDVQELKSIQQDLEELNRTLEDRIRKATAEIEDLYDNAPSGYHSLDPEGRFIIVNQTELNWLGYSREEMIGQHVTKFFTESTRDFFKSKFKEFSQTGKLRDAEFEFIRKDGTIMPVMVNATMIRDEQGNFIKSRSVLFDQTERKKADAALMESQTRLRISTEELRRANADLERAARMKDEFLANMSHELRTPLNAILGLSDILAGQFVGVLNERQLRSISTIRQSARHLLELINDILDLSKMQAQQLSLDLAPVVVMEVCESSLAFVRDAAQMKNIHLAHVHDPAAEVIRADGRRLRQMLINLLTNAIKFTPEGGSVILEVTGNVSDKTMSFAIRDTGEGIAPENIGRLFQPFVQLESGLNRRNQGTGLGLSLVDRMAKLHGGSVTVESELGKGSCFTIIVPWSAPLPAIANPKSALEKSDGISSLMSSDPGKTLVLLAEDNESNIETISAFLEILGVRYNVAKNGVEALEQVHRLRPSLILMDLQMPVMDGLEAIRRLRSDDDPDIAGIPVIVVSALAMYGDLERSLEAGANDYLSKPVDLKNLAEMIKKYTGNHD